MSNVEHLNLLNHGVDRWNTWRHEQPETKPDLFEANLFKAKLNGADLSNTNLGGAYLFEANLFKANLSGSNLSQANLRQSNLFEANLRKADLSMADLSKADLTGADLMGANLSKARLSKANLGGTILAQANLSGVNLRCLKLFKANLREANLRQADLTGADFTQADLSGADLMDAKLLETQLENVNLNGCRIHGISAWNLKVNQDTRQSDLIITLPGEAIISVSDLEVAQFISLLLNRKKLRNILNTVSSRLVLILGCFTSERKVFIEALSERLRVFSLLPIILNFEQPSNQDLSETIKILADLSLFVILDITKPKSGPPGLTSTIPGYQTPFVPILQDGEDSYSIFEDFEKYDWALKPVLRYRNRTMLLKDFRDYILGPAWEKHLELRRKKNEELETISIEEMMKRNNKEFLIGLGT